MQQTLASSKDIPLWTAKVTGIFCGLAAAVYAAVEVEPSSAVTLFLSFNSGDSIQQLTNSMRKMQTLAPWQGSPEWSFQIFRITSCSEACAGWMFSSPLTTDKNTSTCYLNRLRNTRRIFLLGV